MRAYLCNKRLQYRNNSRRSSGNGTGSPIGAGQSATATATGSADRVVSRRTGRGSSGRVDLPYRGCPGEPLAATKLHPEGPTIGHRGGQTTLGCERESTNGIPFGAGQHG